MQFECNLAKITSTPGFYNGFPWHNHFSAQRLCMQLLCPQRSFLSYLRGKNRPGLVSSPAAGGGYRTFEYVLGDKSIYPSYVDTPYDY